MGFALSNGVQIVCQLGISNIFVLFRRLCSELIKNDQILVAFMSEPQMYY